MNLATSYEALGQRVQALNYYQQSQDLYQQNGDDRRAAEQEAMVAGLLIDFGSNQAEALRRLNNARASFRTLGHMEGEVFTREAEAANNLHQGRHEEARQQLRAAISMAKERGLGRSVMSMTAKLADSYIETGEYQEARLRLEEAGGTGTAREDLEVAIALGRVHGRVGDFDDARERLSRTLASVETSGLMALVPSALTALGEVQYQSNRVSEARAYFEKAAALGTEDLPDAASVAAKCWIGLLEAEDSKVPKAGVSVETSIRKAADMGRLNVESHCRLAESRIHFSRQQYASAESLLRPIPIDGDPKVGPELAAQVHYWRGRTLSEQGNRDGAQLEVEKAQKLLRDLMASLPESLRNGFASRRDVRRVLENDVVPPGR
jgi:tetratricopeptide (TPR) repeat protein